ncbi:sigma-70 family RNA polymerase sigma factor [Raphidiopsis sp. BLCC-F218]
MQIPSFPETNHPLVRSLFEQTDQELLNLFQRYPDSGRYFTAIFARYHPIVYTLVQHSAKSPVQADYLFALTWQQIYYEMRELSLEQPINEQEGLSLQNWLINMTAFCINRISVPPAEAIHYSLKETSPPLWCYLQQALDKLPPILRVVLLMARTFHWSETRIAAYLQAEGENISIVQVSDLLQQSYQILEEKLDPDIRVIYLEDGRN